MERTFILISIMCYSNAQQEKSQGNVRDFNFEQIISRMNMIFNLYTRRNLDSPEVNNGSVKDFQFKTFNSSNDSKFIIHGYASPLLQPRWTTAMKDSFLDYGEFNVFILTYDTVGTQTLLISPYSYSEAVNNTPVVANEIVQVIKLLKERFNVPFGSFHLIGHGLGAHIAGFVGKKVPGLKRISGLDPAGPLYKTVEAKSRLDRADADFVDVYHTNIFGYIDREKERIPFGLGLEDAIGTVDFFVAVENVILFQCITQSKDRDPVCVFSKGIQDYALSSIQYMSTITQNPTCIITGIECLNVKDVKNGVCGSCEEGSSNCRLAGYFSDSQYDLYKDNKQHKVYVTVTETYPFCKS